MRLDAINQPAISVDPFRLPFLAPNMLKDFDPFEGGLTVLFVLEDMLLANLDFKNFYSSSLRSDL